jgi:hypothetical protein
VIDYIRNQREHHAWGTTHERLEWITQDEAPKAAQAIGSEKGRERP